MTGPTREEILDFPELWRTLNRYRWRVLFLTAVAAVAGFLSAYSSERYYPSAATILIETRPDRVVQIQEVYDPGYGTQEYLSTQAALLRSNSLVGSVVDKLGLVEDSRLIRSDDGPTLLQRAKQVNWSAWFSFLPPRASTPEAGPDPDALRKRTVAAIQERLSIAPVFRTQLVRVEFESVSPQLSAKVVNALVDAFVDSGLDARLDATERTTRWLTDRISDIRKNLTSAEGALQNYREKNQLVNVGGTRGLMEDEVVDNSRKLREAQRKKGELEAAYALIREAGSDRTQLENVGPLLMDPLVQRASAELAQAEQVVRQLEERYGNKHPQMASAQARLSQARVSYDNQLRLAANGIKVEYELAAESERSLTRSVEIGRAKIRDLDRREFELRNLEREAQTTRELYEVFQKRFKETDTTLSLDASNARVVDYGMAATRPSKPATRKIVLIWTLGGFALAIALAALQHLLTETVRSAEQLEDLTGIPVIAALPQTAGLGRRTSAVDMCLKHPRLPFSEGIRSIRSSLFLSDVDRRMKRIMFTSAMPSEGKSSIASGFAVTLGQLERVLLVEADLRAPSLKKIFGIPADKPGLLEVLTDQAKLEDAVHRDATSGVDVLAVSKLPASPAEVISSTALQRLIENLGTRYDRLVFDCPPCLVASDSMLLSSKVDAVVFVIHAGKTSLRSITTALRQLRGAQATLLGHALNHVSTRNAYGYYGQYYAYGKYGK